MIENHLDVQSFDSAEDTLMAAAQKMLNTFTQTRNAGQNMVVLLAGGSATKVYSKVTDQLQAAALEAGALSHVTLAVEDDRWPSLNNSSEIEATELIKTCQALGATFWRLPVNDDIDIVAHSFDAWLKTVLSAEDMFVLLIAGIGPDGHTLGINADTNEAHFSQLFQGEDWAVSYTSQAQTAQFGHFPTRVTMTLTALSQVDEVILLALGTEKVSTLQDLIGESKPLHLMPAQALKQQKLVLFTDQPI